MSLAEIAAAGAGACILLTVLLGVTARRPDDGPPPVTVPPRWRLATGRAWRAIGGPTTSSRARRRRVLVCVTVGTMVWALTGWPATAVATVVAGLWLPWLLGSAHEVRERIEKLEALETWCRRMADTLAGGGAVGLMQAITMFGSRGVRADEPIAAAVDALARSLREGSGMSEEDPRRAALREFADAVDDRAGDTVAAALLLALSQQSSGVAPVLRQLAEGVARDVRARRDIEAARAEDRQSIRLLLIVQVGILALLAAVPSFAEPYGTGAGQVVMVVLLTGTAGLLVWMRVLALGRPAPRFFGAHLSGHGGQL